MRIAAVMLALLCPLAVLADGLPVLADVVDDIVRIHIEALGGADALEAVRNVVSTGVNRVDGRDVSVRLIAAWPARLRVETKFGADHEVVQVCDGDVAWRIRKRDGATQVESMSADEARALRSDSDFDGPLVDPDRKKHRIEYLGDGEVRGRPVLNLRVTEANGLVTEVALDAETYLIARRSVVRRYGEETVKLDSFHSFYRPVAGVQMAHRIETIVNDGASEAVTDITLIRVNEPLDDDLFLGVR